VKPRKNEGVEEWPPGSGKFRIDYYDREGRRHREMIGSEKLAINVYRQRKTEIWEGRFIPKSHKPKTTFEELAETRMAAKKIRLAPGSYYSDQKRLKPLIKEFGSMPAEEVSVDKINAFLATLRESRSGSTVNRYRSLLSNIFTVGIRSGTVAFNPVSRVDKFRESDSRIRFLDAEEEKSLRAAVRAQSVEHEAELDLALHTGIRRGEQFGLTWDRVDLGRGILTVYGKTGRRFVPINLAARAAIELLWRASNGSKYLCPDKRSDDQEDWRRWLVEACAAAKVENFRWHDLRHTFASRLVMAGVDLRSIQELLGHKSIVTTQRYAHLSPDHQKANVQKLVAELKCMGCARGGRERRAVHISGNEGLCDDCFREMLRWLDTQEDTPSRSEKNMLREVPKSRRRSVVAGVG
jgi:site-specific recombinase XerD